MQLKRNPIFLTLLALLLFLPAGCQRTVKPPVPTVTPPVVEGTPEPPLKAPSGRTYRRTRVSPPDDDEPVNIPSVRPGTPPDTDSFHGVTRAAAKLAIVQGTARSFNDLGDVLDSLPSDESMRAMHISSGAGSGRLPQEQALVTVTAFLYAASHETDNDFHCIVGRDPSLPARFMNVEVSGLPPSDSVFFAPLTAARNEFKVFFTSNGNALPAQGYHKYAPPIPIRVTGSLFFDVDHVPPAVGPPGMKPQTAWEIHPVSDIQFEP